MKKNTTILLALICSTSLFSQVGVNTSDPKATFDIVAKQASGSSRQAEGLLVPRVDRERAQSMTGVVASTLVYVNSVATGTQTGFAANIDTIGYYFFNGSLWEKLNPSTAGLNMQNIYNSDGILTTNRTVTMDSKNLILNSSTGSFQINGNNDGFYRSHLRNLSTGANSRMDVNIGAGSANIYLGADNSSAIFGAGTKAYLDNRTGGRFVIGTNGVENVTINADGNVGIGNDSPSEKLAVIDKVNSNPYHGIASFFANNLTQGVGIGYNGMQAIGTNGDVNLNLNGKNTGHVVLQTNSSGNVGIGTTNPTRKLDIQGSQSINAAITAGATTDVIDINIGQDAYAYGSRGDNFGIRMRTSSSVQGGNVARINFGDMGTVTNTGNRYLSFSVGKTLKELMYMDDINGGRVGIGTSAPNSNAALEIASTNQGFLPPRLTTVQRNAITNAPAGLIVYNTTTNCLDFWNSSAWVSTCATATPPAGVISMITCTSSTNTGVLTIGSAASGVSSSIPYTGGNGGSHGGQTIASTGVTGLTATLSAGSFVNGNGNLTYTIIGIPSGIGTANFAINIGGKTCTLSRTVIAPAGTIATLNCTGATLNGTLRNDQTVSGVTITLPYTGGNGGAYATQSVASTGVPGLTATLSAGNFVNGNGNLTLSISGKPLGEGTANFNVTVGGKVCTISVAVSVINSGEIICSSPGYYPYPNVANKYFQCVLIGGKYYYYVYTCPPGSGFDPVQKLCVVGYGQ